MSWKPGELTVDACNIRKILKIADAHNWKIMFGIFVWRAYRRSCRTKCPSAKNTYFKACFHVPFKSNFLKLRPVCLTHLMKHLNYKEPPRVASSYRCCLFCCFVYCVVALIFFIVIPTVLVVVISFLRYLLLMHKMSLHFKLLVWSDCLDKSFKNFREFLVRMVNLETLVKVVNRWVYDA